MKKLTPETVKRLRAEYQSMKASGAKTALYLRQQARALGVTRSAVYYAATGRTWRKVRPGERGK